MAPQGRGREARSATRIEADPEEAGDLRRRPGTRSPTPRRSRPRSLKPYNFLERGFAFDSQLFHDRPRRSSASPRRRPSPTPTGSASTATRPATRSSSPLFSDAPIYPEFEKAKLAHSLAFWKKTHGADDPLVEQRPRRAGRPSRPPTSWSTARKLADVAVRKKLAEGGTAAIDESRRPDDQARPGRRRRRPGRPEAVARTRSRGSQTAQYALIAKAHLRGPGGLGLSRRHVHPPAGLRHGQGLRGRRQDDPALTPRSAAPSSTPRRTATSRPTSCPPSWLEAKDDGPAEPRHAAQLRLDGRHHRRQLGQPGRQPRQRGRRPDLRRQHPVARPRLRLRRPASPAPSRSTRGRSSRP